MSLATRCTSCGTVFRVVQDQLKVSEGWVRCGRCDAVFNAAEGLFDLERETPPSWSPTQPPAEAPEPAFEPLPADASSRPVRYPAAAYAPVDGDSFDGDGDGAGGLGVVAPAPPAPAAVPADLISTALARHASEIGTTASPTAALGFGTESLPADDVGETTAGDAWRPDAERRRPGRATTGLLVGASLLLAAVLAAQATAQFSEIAAARWPAARQVLVRWCGVAGCSLAPPRRIEDIVVDSSALAPVIGTDALKLGIALRNRAGFAVAVPSVELSLTDSTGRLLARRTLHPADFQVASASALGPGAELPLQALLAAGTTPVTGYIVEIYYP